MLRHVLMLSLTLATGVFAAELPEKFARKLNSADETYKTAVQKADAARFYAVQKANLERIKVLKAALVEATKAGDFDTATEVNSRLTATPLKDEMLANAWQGPTGWGRFTFDSDGMMSQDSRKNTNIKWFVIYDDSGRVTIHHEGQFQVLRFIFSKDRKKVTVFFVGRQGSANWEGTSIP